MAKINRSFRLLPETVGEIKQLVALKYGKSATEAIEKAVHAAVVATAETKTKKGKPC